MTIDEAQNRGTTLILLVLGYLAGALLTWWTPVAGLIGGGLVLVLALLSAVGIVFKLGEQ